MPQIRSLGRRDRRDHPTPESGSPSAERTLELLVVEGPDAGSQFTIDGETIRVGRGSPESGRTGQIGVRDPTVSPSQATLYVGLEGVEIEHRQGATNPTLVNGSAVARAPIGAGDRIQMGRTVFEVRSRPGISLSGLMSIPRGMMEPPPREPDAARTEALPGDAASTTEIRAALPPEAEIVVLRGIPALEGRRFPLVAIRSRVGRHPANDIVLTEQGVSRFHAELVWEDEALHLVHKSGTNPSYVDGRRVDDRVPLRNGQEIRLADRVMLRIDIPEPAPSVPDTRFSKAGPEPSLKDLMEEKVRRDAEIERDYGFTGSFLDIDVVDSHGLKVRAERPEHIIVSFERFRAFAQQVVEGHEGQVLNSNGDELMCFFDQAPQAVRAAVAVLDRLADFNARRNLLANPFRVRQGIHTGSSLLDRVRGVAYSPVLDVAGHLQKHAPEDGLLVSAETLAHLPDASGFSPVGELGKERVSAHRLERSPVRASLEVPEMETPPREE